MKTEPFIDEKKGIAGIKCTRSDGFVSYVFLNPSDNEEEKDFDVFVYTSANDIDFDLPECYIVPYFTPSTTEERQ
jgi:hypothetical protein